MPRYRKAVVIVIILAAVLIVIRHSNQAHKQYPFEIAFVDPNSEIRDGKVILLCDQNGGISKLGSTKPGNDYLMPLGYNAKDKYWIAVESDLSGSNILKMSHGKSSRLVFFRGDSSVDEGWEEVYAGNRLFLVTFINTAPYPANDLGVMCYTLSGSLLYARSLGISNHDAAEVSGGVVSSNGFVAVACGRYSGSSYTQVYLFDPNGKMLKFIGLGENPNFDPKGKRIAYWKLDHPRRGVIIYDIKSGNRRYLPLNHPPYSDAEPAGLRWSPDDDWLLCSYASGYPPRFALYAVNIAGKELKWVEYPMWVEDEKWIGAKVEKKSHP